MAKATIVKISSIRPNGIGVWWNDKPFTISAFDGYGTNLKVIAPPSEIIRIHQFAEFIIGCFESCSTFYGVESITFTFEKVTVTVHKKEAKDNPAYVIEQWEKANAEKAKKALERLKFSGFHLEDIYE